jgi:hypothetical protein
MMQFTDFYQQAVKAVEDILRARDSQITAARLRCEILAGDAAHTREGHPEISVHIWSDRNLVDVIEFTPDISYPNGGDTLELGAWFDRELNQAIEDSGTQGP